MFTQPIRNRKMKQHSRTLGFLFYQSMYAPAYLLKALYRQLIILVGMFGLGSWIFMYYEGLPPLDALYASVSTITTIGLFVPHNGVVTSMPYPEVALLIVTIIVSVGAAASSCRGQ